ncbi:unnamed protein product [Bursaphelenchus xylophilus]|uniref:(pine wood nematode) hypothetical protein n=1 Tax=Bursaphelenchus xylophilus TaxID=6326 RepID=A0A1I7S4Q2_BURXY|nr:unnamed protein product [Bursaphelenchus xylophilus]CAG9117291.1 unnamed protein product [Bursaphelenchus xylophilus]
MENNKARPECEAVEIRCKNSSGAFIYENLHLQVFERKKAPEEASSSRPDVVVLLIDSMSHSQYIRSMRKTRDYLQFTLQSIEFPYVTKVALNSRPNAYGFFITDEPIEKYENKFGIYTTADFKPKLCQVGLDNRDFIGFDFNRNGYVTLNNEDWQFGAFSWPGCKGFERPFTNHSNKPFIIRATGKDYKNSVYQRNLYQGVCKEGHQHMLEYLKDFFAKYESTPTFSLSWFTDLAHADPNALFRVDGEFLEFFQKNSKKLENSFVLLMGDHGNRINDIRTTKTGEREEKNPSLSIVLPQAIRHNEKLRNQMKENAGKLVTHYDIYATLLEISQNTYDSYNDQNFTLHQFSFPNRTLLGSSLFHRLPEPRNCLNLDVPLDYCFCEYKKRIFNDTKVIAQAGRLIVQRINKDLADSGLTSRCRELTLDESDLGNAWIFESGAKFGAQILKIKISVRPGRGQYEGLLALEDGDQLTLLTQEFPRIDAYESHAYCVKFSLYRQYCHCK